MAAARRYAVAIHESAVLIGSIIASHTLLAYPVLQRLGAGLGLIGLTFAMFGLPILVFSPMAGRLVDLGFDWLGGQGWATLVQEEGRGLVWLADRGVRSTRRPAPSPTSPRSA